MRANPDSEQIEHTETKFLMRNFVSVEQIQDESLHAQTKKDGTKYHPFLVGRLRLESSLILLKSNYLVSRLHGIPHQ